MSKPATTDGALKVLKALVPVMRAERERERIASLRSLELHMVKLTTKEDAAGFDVGETERIPVSGNHGSYVVVSVRPSGGTLTFDAAACPHCGLPGTSDCGRHSDE